MALLTQNTEGDRIEFDFSECRVIGTRDIPCAGVEIVVSNECPQGTMISANAIQEAADNPRVRALLERGLLE